MRNPACVGALIRDDRHRVYVHRRTADRRLLPGTWDIVGGHIESGESPEAALAREIREETGWELRRIETAFTDWEWSYDGVVRRELDYLVEVDGDLAAPVLEAGKHDAFAWVGPMDLELMMVGRTDGDRRLRDIVAKAVRTRLTDRLRLEPIGPEHAEDLRRLHQDPAVAEWYDGPWTRAQASAEATARGEAWERDGVQRWIAFARESGELVGRGGLALREHGLDVGWTLLSKDWGQGYATEIGRASLDHGFHALGAKEVVAAADTRNARSRAVMERLGMSYVHDFTPPGRAEPFAFYRVTAG